MKYVRIMLAAIALLLVFAFPAWGQETTVSPAAVPEETTASPAATTAPEATTVAPEATTAPEETTASPEATTSAPEQTTAAPVSDGSCQNPQEVITVGPTTENTRTAFTTTGDVFRVSYDVAFEDPDAFNSADIDVEDRFGLVDFAIVDEDEQNSFIVTEGAGSYDLVVNIQPPNGATYKVTIEDCGIAANGNGDNDGNGGDVNGGDVNSGDVNNPDKVIPDTTSKKPLPDTGGVPLLGLAAVALALVGAGFSILRTSTRRDP